MAFTCFLGTTALSAPVPLPDWVKPMESSLPRLSPEVISEVDEIRAFAIDNNGNYSPPVIAQSESNQRRYVHLREQADQAMIWQYLKATSGPYKDTRILHQLGEDRGLAAWLLPIVRFRVEWLEQSMRDPQKRKYLENVFHSFEILDIQNYLFNQGEYSDIENLNLLVENLNLLVDVSRKPKFESEAGAGKKFVDPGFLQEQVQAMQQARIQSERQNQPFWRLVASHLIERGVLDADALEPRPQARTHSAGGHLPKPLGPRKPLPEIKPLNDYPQPWMVWQIWLFLLVVTAGLLRWLFRKPRSASKLLP